MPRPGNTLFGKKLEELVCDSGKTQSQIAKEIGFAQSQLCMWIQGKREPAYYCVCLVAQYFGLPVGWFNDQD